MKNYCDHSNLYAHEQFPLGSYIGYYPVGMVAKYANLCAALSGWQFVSLPLFGPIPDRVCAIAGWGRRTLIANWGARLHRKPLISIEDGFFRSIRLGLEGDDPLSLVFDTRGIYYDARSPSDLEDLLERGGWETPDLLRRAETGIAEVRRRQLSKYNDAPMIDEHGLGLTPRSTNQTRVLVIDQTRNDRSIVGALASAGTFHEMLSAAKDENPGAQIIVKIHPSVASGKRRGHLDDAANDPRFKAIMTRVNIWSLLNCVDVVYTVSSQVGFEALIAGLPVHCFGLPFYAGWGATIDRQSSPRRTRRRAAEEIFAAACLLYTRYSHPVSHGQALFEDYIEAFSAAVESYHANQALSPRA